MIVLKPTAYYLAKHFYAHIFYFIKPFDTQKVAGVHILQ